MKICLKIDTVRLREEMVPLSNLSTPIGDSL